MNYIDQCLNVLERLIKLCKELKRENEALKRDKADDLRIISELRDKWQREVNLRLSGK